MADQTAPEAPSDADVPTVRDLLWPTLLALREADTPLDNDEVVDSVIDQMELTEEQQSVPHGNTTKVAYRVAWARTRLKKVGAVDNPTRGRWAATGAGRAMTESDLVDALREVRRAEAAERRARDDDEADRDDDERTWQDELLELLREMDPYAFERLCKRLLKEVGFLNVEVVGGSGDGGIDGVGVYRMALISFPVFFQAKRYRNPVRAHAVRDFRGAMSGRGEKGMLITTSTFTRDAEHEAVRDGAPPVDLIDGPQLCDLLAEYGIGVVRTPRTVYDHEVAPGFFATV